MGALLEFFSRRKVRISERQGAYSEIPGGTETRDSIDGAQWTSKHTTHTNAFILMSTLINGPLIQRSPPCR
jgi:hypothetical protein